MEQQSIHLITKKNRMDRPCNTRVDGQNCLFDGTKTEIGGIAECERLSLGC